MSEAAVILFVLAGAAAIWQIVLFVGWAAMLSSGKYTNVKVGVGPGVVAVILTIVAILL